jgi:SM-20-related protein
VAGDFLADGIVVRDGFLTPERVQELIDCAAQRRARGEFAAARIGTDRGPAYRGPADRGPADRGPADRLQRREDIRGDWTCWFAPPYQPAEERLLHDFEQLRLDLNQESFLGLFDLELHYACYPAGTGYARHVDQPRDRTHRQVSMVLYLNPEWTSAAGGALRLFGAAGEQRDIEPIAGRLVYFLTAGREHEVLPTRAERLSISGWFRRRPRA